MTETARRRWPAASSPAAPTPRSTVDDHPGAGDDDDLGLARRRTGSRRSRAGRGRRAHPCRARPGASALVILSSGLGPEDGPERGAHAHPHRSPAARDRRGLPLLRRAPPRRRTSRSSSSCSQRPRRVAAGHRAARRVPRPAAPAQPRAPPAGRRARQRLPRRQPPRTSSCSAPTPSTRSSLDARMTSLTTGGVELAVDRPRRRAPRRGAVLRAGRGPSRSSRCWCGTSCTPASAEPVRAGPYGERVSSIAPFTEIADRVWVARYEWFDVNVTVIGGADGLLVVDTHASGLAARRSSTTYAAWRRRGAGRRQHARALRPHLRQRDLPRGVRRRPDPRARDRRRADGARRERVKALYDAEENRGDPHRDEVQATEIVPADTTFSSAVALDLGDRQVELVHPGRGHTAGDLVRAGPRRGRAPRR